MDYLIFFGAVGLFSVAAGVVSIAFCRGIKAQE